jgi:glycosyltransferase involved in cell wall biosynthesis
MAQMIAYLIHSFPLFSSTFVNDEIDEMRRQGCRIAVFAVQRPSDKEFPPAFARFREETAYVFPIRKGAFLRRHLAAALGRPWRYFGSLAWILGRRGQSPKDRIRSVFHFAEAVYLYPEIKARGCRHIHVHFLLGGAALALFLNRLYGMSYSLTAHGSDIFLEKALQAEKLERSIYTRVATRYNAEFLRPNLPPGRASTLEVIPFGIDRSGLPPGPPESSAGPELRVLAVGRLIWQKAHHLLLEACATARRKGFRFRLRLVGEGPLRPDLEARILALDLAGTVTLEGAWPRERVWAEYRKADLFVLSSVSEGSPFVILEAMAAGLPVLAPALHGIPEMIRDGRDGLLFETGSADSLAEGLERLLGDAALRQRLGSAAEAAANDFDHSRSVGRFRESLFASIAAAQHGKVSA